MKKYLYFSLIIFAITAIQALNAQNPVTTPIFTGGDDGYNCYRIPSIVKTNAGTLLAFAEARKRSCSDTGDIDLVVKRSNDNGKTWSSAITIWNDGDNVCGNPSPVVDRSTGRILLLSTWNRGDDHEKQILAGTSKDTRRVFVLHSDDDGLTWSTAREITATTKKDNWTWYATGPCHGIQLQSKKYKNRLVVASNHMVAGTITYHSQLIYSDDAGATWKLGGVVTEHGGNESTVVELKNGDLMINMRNYNRDVYKARSYAISKDGGETFQPMQYAPELMEPRCQASILNATRKGKITDRILFSNPGSTDKREKMTVRLSTDNGKTWPSSVLVYDGPSAYSDIVMLSDTEVVVYYEYGVMNPYENMGFAIIPLSSFK